MSENVVYQPIMVPRGEVVRIGKLGIRGMMEKFGHEIPMFSFMNIKKSNDSFVSTCIHLRMDGYGETEDDAVNDMAGNVCYFLLHNFSDLSSEDAWENIRSLFAPDDWSNPLWEKYHDFQFLQAKQGKRDLTTDLLSKLAEAREEAEELKRQTVAMAAVLLFLKETKEQAEKEWYVQAEVGTQATGSTEVVCQNLTLAKARRMRDEVRV